jgi:hypothetical protein
LESARCDRCVDHRMVVIREGRLTTELLIKTIQSHISGIRCQILRHMGLPGLSLLIHLFGAQCMCASLTKRAVGHDGKDATITPLACDKLQLLGKSIKG